MGNPISCLLSSPLSTRICDGFWEFGVRHAAYVYQLEDNLEALLKAAEDLRMLKKMMVRKIRDEKRHRMQTSEDVELWLSRVEAATAKADRLKKEGEQAVQRLCLGGICSTHYFSTSVSGEPPEMSNGPELELFCLAGHTSSRGPGVGGAQSATNKLSAFEDI